MSVLEENILSIKFYLYEYQKVKKEAYPIYARIIYKREKSDISMKMTASPKKWDFENEMFYPDSPHARYLNNKLISAKDEMNKIFRQLKEDNKQYFTVKTIRKLFRGELTEHSTMCFIDYYDSYVNNCKNRPHEYGAGVLAHYSKTRRHLVNYMASVKMQNITLKGLNRNFIVGFQHYLLSSNIVGKGYPMNQNTATTYLRKLKASVNKALEKELIDKNPFLGFKLPRIKTSKIVYLNKEEIDLIKNHDLAMNKSLMRVRDIFLFSLYTGLRFSDTINLCSKNIKKDANGFFWIRINQMKTKEALEVPMLAPAVAIYEKYKSEREQTGYILPQACSQKVNSYLKTIAKLVGIDKNLTHHVARHSFATTINLDNGVDLKTVSKLLGHTSIRSTEIYAQITRNKLTETVGMLNDKLK